MNSFIGWIGGKKLLRKEIITRFPKSFDRYIEVFGGAGWVLFGSKRHSQTEIYNDINSDLVNLFFCIKENCNELQKELEWLVNSREIFEKSKFEIESAKLSNVQRAARFFYMVAFSYGCNTREFCCKAKGVINAVEYLKKVQKRLNMVIIENKNFEDLIKVYDRENALFYCDPPYFGAEKLYKKCDFGMTEHIKLKDILSRIKGKFILSYNDCETVRGLYKVFRIEEVERQNNLVSRYGSRVYKELLVMNW